MSVLPLVPGQVIVVYAVAILQPEGVSTGIGSVLPPIELGWFREAGSNSAPLSTGPRLRYEPGADTQDPGPLKVIEVEEAPPPVQAFSSSSPNEAIPGPVARCYKMTLEFPSSF